MLRQAELWHILGRKAHLDPTAIADIAEQTRAAMAENALSSRRKWLLPSGLSEANERFRPRQKKEDRNTHSDIK